MKLYQLTGTGKREQNEDSKLVLQNKQIYMVCDGVGGAAKGEIASKLCCNRFFTFFTEPGNDVNEETIQQAIVETEMTFDDYFLQHKEAKGMATTLAFLSLQGDKAFISHIGDSRVYLIRNGKIIFVTADHSLVNEMLASGFITEEEAVDHPKKNHITRAIQGTDNPVKADIHFITELQEGDFFLLCSDGVLESVSEEFIAAECICEKDPADIISEIELLCAAGSRDNYTCIILKLDEKINKKEETINSPAKEPVNRKKRYLNRFVLFLVLIVIAVIVYLVFAKTFKKEMNSNPSESTSTKSNKIKPAPNPVNQQAGIGTEQKPVKADSLKEKN